MAPGAQLSAQRAGARRGPGCEAAEQIYCCVVAVGLQLHLRNLLGRA